MSIESVMPSNHLIFCVTFNADPNLQWKEHCDLSVLYQNLYHSHLPSGWKCHDSLCVPFTERVYVLCLWSQPEAMTQDSGLCGVAASVWWPQTSVDRPPGVLPRATEPSRSRWTVRPSHRKGLATLGLSFSLEFFLSSFILFPITSLWVANRPTDLEWTLYSFRLLL